MCEGGFVLGFGSIIFLGANIILGLDDRFRTHLRIDGGSTSYGGGSHSLSRGGAATRGGEVLVNHVEGCRSACSSWPSGVVWCGVVESVE